MENETETTTTTEAAKTESDALRAQLATVKQETETMAEALLSGVPDRLKALIPEGDAAAKVKWFLKAKASGVFEPVKVPETDKGKPTVTPKEADLSTLSPIARMSRGYKK